MFKFKNVGKDIKTLARIVAVLTFIPFCIGAFALVIGGLGMLIADGDEALVIFVGSLLGAAVVVLIGYFVARISAIMLYGYGELIDLTKGNNVRLTVIEAKLNKPAPVPVNPQPVAPAEE